MAGRTLESTLSPLSASSEFGGVQRTSSFSPVALIKTVPSYLCLYPLDKLGLADAVRRDGSWTVIEQHPCEMSLLCNDVKCFVS